MQYAQGDSPTQYYFCLIFSSFDKIFGAAKSRSLPGADIRDFLAVRIIVLKNCFTKI